MINSVNVIVSALLAISTADDDGKYRPDNSGKYIHDPNDGQYIPDDSGKYIADYSGAYYYDGSGLYKPDGSGVYRLDDSGKHKYGKTGFYSSDGKFLGDGSDSKYKPSSLKFDKSSTSRNRNNQGASSITSTGSFSLDSKLLSDFYSKQNSDSSRQNQGRYPSGENQNLQGQSDSFTENSLNSDGNLFTASDKYPSSANLIGAGTNENVRRFHPGRVYAFQNLGGTNQGVYAGSSTKNIPVNQAFGISTAKGSGFGSSSLRESSFGSSSLKGSAYGQGRYADGYWKILKQNNDIDLDGYHWDYETENKIIAEETGRLANKGSDQEAMRAFGSYQYTGPDNVVYSVKYTADERGFLPEGAHLPTPPPIPDAILRSLEFLRANGKL